MTYSSVPIFNIAKHPIGSNRRFRFAIVGNAQPVADLAEVIDSADCVIRFNRPTAFGGEYGKKIDSLCLGNSGGQVYEWLHRDTFVSADFFENAKHILLPYSPAIVKRHYPALTNLEGGRQASHQTESLLELMKDAGKSVDVVRGSLYLKTFFDLGLSITNLSCCWLSSGIMATAHLLTQICDAVQLEIYGFSWQGWSGHPWAQERSWFYRAQLQEKLCIM